jgi:hypothetical protein
LGHIYVSDSLADGQAACPGFELARQHSPGWQLELINDPVAAAPKEHAL